jgi:hypothetical protein
MRISFSRETTSGRDQYRQAIDNMNMVVARITTADTSPFKPGETFDVQIRQCDWGSTNAAQILVREFDRARGERLGGNTTVIVERIHIY